MATKKNNNEKKQEVQKNEGSLKFIDVLNDFREGKDLNVETILRNMSIQELMVVLDKVFVQLSVLKEQVKDEVQYEIEKQRIIFFYGLLQCTSLEIEKDEMTLNNYDIGFEDCILSKSYSGRKLYKMIDNISLKMNLEIIDSLTKELQNAPSVEELNNLEKGLDNIFSKRSSEDLRKIESILEFNDPNLKLIKDIITAPQKVEKKELNKNGNKVTER